MAYFEILWARGRRNRWIASVLALVAVMCTYVHFEANRIRPAFDALRSPLGKYTRSYIEDWCRNASDPKVIAKRARDADSWDYYWLGLSGRLAASRAGCSFDESNMHLRSIGVDWYESCMARLVDLNTHESLNEFISVLLNTGEFVGCCPAECVFTMLSDLGQPAIDALDRYVPESGNIRRKLKVLREELVQDIAKRAGK